MQRSSVPTALISCAFSSSSCLMRVDSREIVGSRNEAVGQWKTLRHELFPAAIPVFDPSVRLFVE